MTINQCPNRTSTMRLISRGRLAQFVSVSVSFSIPGAARRVSQSVVAKQ